VALNTITLILIPPAKKHNFEMENFKNQTMVHTSKTVSLASYIVYKSELVYRILKSGTNVP